MPRYKLTVEYDGTDYVGWQHQANGRSIQQALEEAVHGFSGETVRVHGAGRTDAGVHALGQCCHLDLARSHTDDKVRDAINGHLKQDRIAVLQAEPAADDFDARRDATRRVYRYRIVTRRAPLALDVNRAWHVARPLDVAAMRAAAERLVGTHDFTSFRAAQCQARSPVRTLELFALDVDGDVLSIEARSRSFLHNQIRAMVGTLVDVGVGRRAPGDIDAILEARDRREAGANAPPAGLYLAAVHYGVAV